MNFNIKCLICPLDKVPTVDNMVMGKISPFIFDSLMLSQATVRAMQAYQVQCGAILFLINTT